jgi:hypothetical protein
MATSSVQYLHDTTALSVNGKPIPAIAAYIRSDKTHSFVQAGVKLYTSLNHERWWMGADTYDFSGVEGYIAEYMRSIPEDAMLMPRIDLGRKAFLGGAKPTPMKWWWCATSRPAR